MGVGTAEGARDRGCRVCMGHVTVVQMVAASLRATRCSKEGIYWLALKKKGETKLYVSPEAKFPAGSGWSLGCL